MLNLLFVSVCFLLDASWRVLDTTEHSRCFLNYLHPGFSQVRPQCQLLPGVNVRIVRLLENLLQLLQLVACEGRAVAPLLALVAFAAIALVQRARQVCAKGPVGGRLHALILHGQVAGVHAGGVGISQLRIRQA